MRTREMTLRLTEEEYKILLTRFIGNDGGVHWVDGDPAGCPKANEIIERIAAAWRSAPVVEDTPTCDALLDLGNLKRYTMRIDDVLYRADTVEGLAQKITRECDAAGAKVDDEGCIQLYFEETSSVSITVPETPPSEEAS